MDENMTRWKRFIDRLPAVGPLHSVILESWYRSQAAEVEPQTDPVEFRQIPGDDLQRRLAENADWLAIARPHLEWLASALAQVPHVVYLTDRDGIVLHSLGDPLQIETFRLAPGFDWSERQMGTNGAGTALAADRPVAVVGAQHFIRAFADCTCTGAPIHTPDGAVVGAIDITTSVEDGSPERLALAAHAAYAIEREIAYRTKTEFLKQLEAVVEIAPCLIVVADPDGHIVLFNLACEALTGYRREEVLGKEICEQFVPPEWRSTVEARFIRSDPSELRQPHENPWRTKSGEERLIEWRCMVLPQRDQSGRCFLVGTGVDVTDRDQMEQELRKQAEELSQADGKKNEFLAMLAHELRNPLAPIRHGLQVLRLADKGSDVAERAQSIMERQVQQMMRLVDDLLDVSRINRGKLELRSERVDLRSVIRSAIDASRPLIGVGDHEVEAVLPSQPLPLNADPMRLNQVFCNLLNNATKYTERGGVICVTVERQGGDAVVGIRDTGIGIAQDNLAAIFDVFSQVGSTRERSQGGLGIGLALVRTLVEMHKGTVEARSEGIGKGSEFIVRLPLVIETPASLPSQPRRSTDTSEKPSCRILVVDDDPSG